MSTYEICNFIKHTEQVQYSDDEKDFIDAMPNLLGHEWDGKLQRPPWSWGDRKKINSLKKTIARFLETSQGDFCSFCGMPFGVTSSGQIEHVAPKGPKRYPEYMFYPNNLVLACGLCNGFEKKERKEFVFTIGSRGPSYEEHYFNIVHPKLDDPEDHYDFGDLGDRITIASKTLKGQKSISMLKLDEEPHTTERGKLFMKHSYDMDPLYREWFDEYCEKLNR